MFKVGDTVIHPSHGFCKIRSSGVEINNGIEKELLVLQPLDNKPGNFRILLDKEELSMSGVRYPIEDKKVTSVLKALKQSSRETIEGSKDGYFTAQERLRSGNIYQIAAVVRDVAKSKKLMVNHQKDKIIQEATKKLIDEIAYSKGIKKEQAKRMIENAIGRAKKGGSDGKKKK